MSATVSQEARDRQPRRLLLLRHGKALGAAGPTSEAGDHARDLSERGALDAMSIGEALRRLALQPELILVSSALRTRRTWERLGTLGDPAPEVVVTNRLYLAEAEELLSVLHEIPDSTGSVMMIGHNPGLHELALHFASGSPDGPPPALAAGMPTCTLVTFDVESFWHDISPSAIRRPRVIHP